MRQPVTNLNYCYLDEIDIELQLTWQKEKDSYTESEK